MTIVHHGSPDNRKAREVPVQMHFGKLEGARRERVRRGIRTEDEGGRIRVPQVKARLVDALWRANRVAPIEQRRRNRHGADANNGDMVRSRELSYFADGGVVRNSARNDVSDGG